MAVDDNILDSLLSSTDEKGKKQEIRQDEITGKKFLFHSLPKEFYNWFNNYYMLEKKMRIDIASVPSAQLNGYMWLSIFDGTKYALILFFTLIGAFIKLEIGPNLASLLISFFIYTLVLIYVVWHIEYYAKMRAKKTGPVTEEIIKATTKIYYSTFISVFVSLVFALAVFISMLTSFLDLFQQLINHFQLSNNYLINNYLLPLLVTIYNFFVDIVNTGGNNAFVKFLTNPYVFLFYMTLYSAIVFYFFEKDAFEKETKLKEKEIEHESVTQGYPIEYALKKIHNWREKNGM